MRGFVPTPEATVDQMVEMLFENNTPKPTDKILDPGCGPGAFIEGILRWCQRHNATIPQIVGVELDPQRAETARNKFDSIPQITILNGDFLLDDVKGLFSHIICNPPYVSILGLTEEEKLSFRTRYKCASGRFDLYMLFFERSVSLCEKSGTLVFITPEKYTYVQTGMELRKLLGSQNITDIVLLQENVFPGKTTYPAITKLRASANNGNTNIHGRDGTRYSAFLPDNGESWRHLLSNANPCEITGSLSLQDICRRISCGIATGADSIFIKDISDLPENLVTHAWPTISGRQLQASASIIKTSSVILMPYSNESRLKQLEEIGELGDYLMQPNIKSRLAMRSCTHRKPWHAFHDAPQMADLLCPKILCKDICDNPTFWIDREGAIVPRHSVYYIVPKDPGQIYDLAEYLNSDKVRLWLFANAQRAANGFLRIQSSVLKRLPIPEHFSREIPTRGTKNATPPLNRQSISAEVLKVA